MPVFHVCTLCSGSRGNAVYFEYDGVRLLFDCGMSRKRLIAALHEYGTTIGALDGIFITHEHSDHVSGLRMICKYDAVPVHITENSARVFCESSGLSMPQNFVLHAPGDAVTIGSVTVTSFPTQHDSCMSVCYRIKTPCHTVGIATDMGCVSEEIKTAFCGTEYMILESNHDENMLMLGPYPYELKRRILSEHGHLSNDAAAAFAAELIASGTQRIMLAHLSEHNNSPLVAMQTALSVLESAGIQDARRYLIVAKPKEAVELV